MNQEILNSYIKAINRIDDYFEYSNESQKDKAAVMEIINNLQEELYAKVRVEK